MKKRTARRKSRRESVNKAVSLYKPMAEALDQLCEKYDVPLSTVIRKFCEDGVRKIADEQRWPELLSIAGLEEHKPNPFNALEGNTYAPCASQYTEPSKWVFPITEPASLTTIPDGVLLPAGVGAPVPRQEPE